MGLFSALSVAAPIVGGLIGRKSAKSAASTQAQAAREATDLQKQQYRTTRADLKPWKTIGASALNELGTLVGSDGRLARPFTRDDFEADPGYEFRREEGIRAIDNSGAARGMQLSGATLKAMERYGQGVASDEYSRAWQRDAAEKDRQYNYLSGLSGAGQNAAAMMGQFGAGYAGRAGDLMTQGANATAAGTVGASNAITGATGSLSNYLQLKNLLRRGDGDGGGSSGSWGNLGAYSYDQDTGRKGY